MFRIFFVNFVHVLLAPRVLDLILVLLTLFGPRMKTDATYKITLVCASVHPAVRPEQIISETALRIFPKRGMMLGTNKGSNVTEPLFS